MEEIWKDVVGYEGRYLISNTGRLKSILKNKEKLIKGSLDIHGYLRYSLSWKLKNKVVFCCYAHQLVAICFLNHKPCNYNLVVNHKDFNRLNNNVQNLEIITQRENTNKKHLKSSSKYTGVYWNKERKKWRVQILINAKRKFLGHFNNEHEAHLAYQNELKNIEL